LNEKEAIEQATADAFVELYNLEMGTSFSIAEYSDAPDVRCKDQKGNTLNLEITLTEDRPGDIQASLGRSESRSLETLKKYLDDVKAGKANLFDRVSCLQGNVIQMIVSRIQPKLNKDYGSNTALVIRDPSPIDWDWGLVADQIKGLVDLTRNPFEKGIWVISYSKDRICRLLQGVTRNCALTCCQKVRAKITRGSGGAL
jgi:hypothetical protein